MSGVQQMVLSLTKWDGKERARGCTEALLAGLRWKGKPMTAAQLSALTGEPARTVNVMLKRHIAAGRVIRGGTAKCATYAVAGVTA
jgi:hypothetical protein